MLLSDASSTRHRRSWCTLGDTAACSSSCEPSEQRTCAAPGAGFTLLRHFAECTSDDTQLGNFGDVDDCAAACRDTPGCRFFVYGLGSSPFTAEDKSGRCWWEYTTSPTCAEGWEPDSYDFYELQDLPGGGGH